MRLSTQAKAAAGMHAGNALKAAAGIHTGAAPERRRGSTWVEMLSELAVPHLDPRLFGGVWDDRLARAVERIGACRGCHRCRGSARAGCRGIGHGSEHRDRNGAASGPRAGEQLGPLVLVLARTEAPLGSTTGSGS